MHLLSVNSLGLEEAVQNTAFSAQQCLQWCNRDCSEPLEDQERVQTIL